MLAVILFFHARYIMQEKIAACSLTCTFNISSTGQLFKSIYIELQTVQNMYNNLLIIKLYLSMKKNFEDVLLKTFKMSSCEDDETDIIFMAGVVCREEHYQ